MPEALARRVVDTIQRFRLFQAGDRVAAAVSGGADSVGLLCLLEELAPALGVSLAVVHVNHQLRGEAADADEAFVESLARERGLPFKVVRIDPARQAKVAARNLEDIARELRYAAFDALVREGWASCVATGHTADDQAETVLARLARGSGLRGLAGIHPLRGVVVRPLLAVRRTELRQYLQARRQPWREDRTNLDRRHLRARIRYRLLPVLEQELGEGFVWHLCQLAEQARRDEALLEELAAAGLQRCARVAGEANAIELHLPELVEPLAGLVRSAEGQRALTMRMVRQALERVRGDARRLSQRHLAQVWHLAIEGTSGKRIDLPGARVERTLESLIVASTTPHRQSVPGHYAVTLPDPGPGGYPVAVAGLDKSFWVRCVDWPTDSRETEDAAAVLDADRVVFPLVLRNWQPSDAYRPQGHLRVRKLTRLLLKRRVSSRQRRQWPVLTSQGRAVWAWGLPVAAEVVPQATTRRVLVIREDSPPPGQQPSDTKPAAAASYGKR